MLLLMCNCYFALCFVYFIRSSTFPCPFLTRYEIGLRGFLARSSLLCLTSFKSFVTVFLMYSLFFSLLISPPAPNCLTFLVTWSPFLWNASTNVSFPQSYVLFFQSNHLSLCLVYWHLPPKITFLSILPLERYFQIFINMPSYAFLL